MSIKLTKYLPDLFSFYIRIPFFSFQIELMTYNAYSDRYYYFRYEVHIFKWTSNGALGKLKRSMQ